jgi:hypothetical protein
LTVTLIDARGPSHPVLGFTWLTHQLKVPLAVVLGVGAVVVKVPPVAVVYQRSVLPVAAVATKALGASPWQYAAGAVTTGAVGSA